MLKKEETENEKTETKTAAAQNPVAISEKYGFKKLFCAENSKPIPAQTSMRITALRFLLIVLVVFIHNNFKAEEILKGALEYGYTPFDYENGLFGRWIQIFISDGIARCAVPLFFMFASYLQFMKGDSYGVLLKKKAKSLVVPYFLWPLLNIGIYVGLKLLIQAVFPGMIERKNWFPMSGWGVKGWLHAFFGYENMAEGRTFGGYVGQLWFVRDLFILIVFSPLLRLAVRKFPVCALLAVSFFYFSDTRPFIVASQALFFYILGFFWAEYNFDLFAFADRIKWKALIPLYLALWLATWKFYGEYSCAYWFMVAVSCLVLLKFSAAIVSNKKAFAAAKYLAGFSFWLFAIHMPFLLNCIQAFWRKILPMTNTFFCMMEYFGVSVLVIVIGTGFGIVLKKICPPLFAILNGERG